MTNPIVPELPANAGRSGNAFTRWLGRCVLRALGWKMTGEWPNVAKLVVIAAPHTSAWDVVVGIAAKVAMGSPMVFMGKKEVFWGPLGWFFKKIGGVPVDRRAPGGIIEEMAQRIREADQMWFVLAPEGTRKPVKKWKTGFWKIAKAADVPVFCVWFHYPDRVLGLGPMVTLSDDMAADMERIRALFMPYQGINGRRVS